MADPVKAEPLAALREAQHTMLHRAIRFNLVALALTMGAMTGFILWFATLVLLLRGGSAVGLHLNLLGVFLPGYAVTWPGAWIGLLWGFVAGAASGALLYWTYSRPLRHGFANQVIEGTSNDDLRAPVMRLSGHALGASLGALGALQLILATNWLVVRGTASQSPTAALLGQYLPGYTVTPLGSIVGALQVFVWAYVASLVVAALYNGIARLRAHA